MILPFKIKTIEPIAISSINDRQTWIKEAKYNLFNLKSDQVMVDFLTDSGTGAMSAEQTACLITGDESYAGSASYHNFYSVINDLTDFKYIYPVHQGRAAEKILFSIISDRGRIIPSNSHFDTTRAHIEYTGGEALDLIDESDGNFKGNMDIDKLQKLLKSNNESIPLIMLTITNNTNGGQPVSLNNIKAVSKLACQYNKLFFIDGCRFAENAFFIKRRESYYADYSIKDIVRKIFSYADGMTMSAKKDAIVHIGGWIATSNSDLAKKIEELVILHEGFRTYGGLAGRDLDAIAMGVLSGLQLDYLQYRIQQVQSLGKELLKLGIPLLTPIGGHAIYVDAKEFLPHIISSQFPGHALAVELYIQGGIRSCEIGSLMFGKKGKTPQKELLRLAIPRRVYGKEHLDYVVSIFEKIAKIKHKIKGMKIIQDTGSLRHFTASLDYIESSN